MKLKQIKPIKTKQINKSKTKIIKSKLIDEIVKIYKKYYERSRIQIIMYYYELGKKVNKEYGKPKSVDSNSRSSQKNDSTSTIIKVLKEKNINISYPNLMYARRFALKYPKIEELIKEQDICWNKIKSNYLIRKKEPLSKSIFSTTVLTNFKKWTSLTNDFYRAIPKIDFSYATRDEKQECIKILEESINKIQRRINYLKKVEEAKR